MIEIKANNKFLFREATGTPFVFLDHNNNALWPKTSDKIISYILRDQFKIWTDEKNQHLVTIFWWEE